LFVISTWEFEIPYSSYFECNGFLARLLSF
jgi:hypothetical protein